MTIADLPLIVFAACNTLRIAAYFPQMFKLARHPAAAASFSHLTWALFAAANLSTAVYAGVVLGDAMLGPRKRFQRAVLLYIDRAGRMALSLPGGWRLLRRQVKPS